MEGYAIQVGAFKDVNNATRLINQLDMGGFDPFLFKDGKVYKVRFGNYKSAEIAQNHGKSLQNQKKIGEFFVVAPGDYTISKLKHNTINNSLRKALSDTAHEYLGVPYVWGGNGEKGFDCSGFTRAVYRLNGISIPRVSADQYKYGKPVKTKDLQAGDLVFFNTNGGSKVSHVGVYIGDGLFIHAPSKGKTVRKDKLSLDYWSSRFIGGKSYL